MIDTKTRTDKAEIMDDFSMEGFELEDALDKIARINRLLGGNKVTLNGVVHLIKQFPSQQSIKIIDIGCGNGDILRMLANYGQRHHLKLELLGIDANLFTVNHAQELSSKYDNISYQCLNIFHPDFRNLHYDIALCTLTLHHFKDEAILSILKTIQNNAALGIVINDLERSKLAYHLFQLFCFTFKLNDMPKKDGLTSILRGFKIKELKEYANTLNFSNHKIRRRWAFRLQWIIKKYECKNKNCS